MPDLPLDQLAAVEPAGPDTPLRAGARVGAFGRTEMTSLERFPYYTAFPFGWFVAALSGELGPGDVRPLRRLARDLVVWRSDSGVAGVMDAHCPHRGASLAVGGEVSGEAIVCPYHRWEWDHQGSNVAIPYRDDPVTDLSIRHYRTVETGGFVLFWYHPDPDQEPLWELPDLDVFAGPGWTDLWPFRCSYHCPWQEVAENYPDNVHLRTIHGAEVVPQVHRLDFDGWFHHLEATFELPTDQGVRSGVMRTDAYGPGLTVMQSSSIVDTVFYLATTPVDWETTTSVMGYRIRRLGEGPAADAAVEVIACELLDELATQWSEDVAIFDNKIHAARVGSSPEDATMLRYRAWAERFYVDGDPVAAGRHPTPGV